MNIHDQILKNNARVAAAMKATGVTVGESISAAKMKKFTKALKDSAPAATPTAATMTFNLFTVATKKTAKHIIHTPSCKTGDRLKKRPNVSFRKISGATADAVLQTEKKALMDAGKPNAITIHDRCCKLFRTPTTTNPPCPNCKSSATVFASSLGVGKKQFTCTACKKLFVVNVPKKERTMKVNVKKNQKKNDRMKAREARQAVRMQKKLDREQRRADRKTKSMTRTLLRATKLLTRLEKMGASKTEVNTITSALGIIAQDAGISTKTKKTATKTAKTKTARKK